MSDDLSPIERCIQGWEMTRELLAEDMAEIRKLRWELLSEDGTILASCKRGFGVFKNGSVQHF